MRRLAFTALLALACGSPANDELFDSSSDYDLSVKTGPPITISAGGGQGGSGGIPSIPELKGKGGSGDPVLGIAGSSGSPGTAPVPSGINMPPTSTATTPAPTTAPTTPAPTTTATTPPPVVDAGVVEPELEPEPEPELEHCGAKHFDCTGDAPCVGIQGMCEEVGLNEGVEYTFWTDESPGIQVGRNQCLHFLVGESCTVVSLWDAQTYPVGAVTLTEGTQWLKVIRRPMYLTSGNVWICSPDPRYCPQ